MINLYDIPIIFPNTIPSLIIFGVYGYILAGHIIARTCNESWQRLHIYRPILQHLRTQLAITKNTIFITALRLAFVYKDGKE